MNKQPTNNQIPGVVLPGRQGWDYAVPYPFRMFDSVDMLCCVVGVSVMGDFVAVQAQEGQTIELYPTDVITRLSEPVHHIQC